MRSRLRSLVRALRHRRDFEEAMAEELRFHVDQYAADLERSGVPRDQALRRAAMELGALDPIKTDCRQARGLRLFDELEQQLRHAVRRLRKTPAFTVTALATLGVCLGANLAIFAVVDSVLLRPLPFPSAGRLVRIFNSYPKAGVPDDGCSLTNYYERRGQLAALAALAIVREDTAIAGEPGSTERITVARVSPEFFATLGIGPVRGRAFTEAETTYRTDNVAILTHALWQQAFNGAPDVIGRRLRLDGVEKTVIGVLPREFSVLSSKARAYLPLASPPEQRGPDRRHWGGQADMIARLAPGVSLADAQAQVDAHNAAMERNGRDAELMARAGFRSLVVPLHADHVAAFRPMLLLVQGGAMFLLLIGAVNLVNLLLIRAAARLQELAVRRAIGASRRHIIGEVMVETTVLTLGGGLVGVAIGAAGVRLLERLGTNLLPLGSRIAFDVRIASAAILGAIVVGSAMSLPIVWFSLTDRSATPLNAQARSSTPGRAAQRLRHTFLVVQIAGAVVLLAGAVLLALSLERVMTVSPGFRSANVSSGQISLPWTRYQDAMTRMAFAERLMTELGRQPGVLGAGVVTNVPLSGRSGKSAATVKGRVLNADEAPHGIYSYGVAGGYFTAMGIPLREGRFLTAEDSRRPERVCVVDEDFARRNWPDGRAIGQQLFQGGQAGPDREAFTIVGIVGAVKQADLADDTAQGAVFYPYVHRADGDIFVVTRTTAAPDAFAGTLRRIARSLDPELPVEDIRSMDGRIADSLVIRRSPALLAAAFAFIALLLTAIGTYGVLAYAVTQRRREIGLRVALGARPADVRRQFMWLALRLLLVGTALGAIGAAMSGRAIQAVLYRVPSFHPAALAGAAAVIGLVCLIACVLPSYRAARISPMEVLNSE